MLSTPVSPVMNRPSWRLYMLCPFCVQFRGCSLCSCWTVLCSTERRYCLTLKTNNSVKQKHHVWRNEETVWHETNRNVWFVIFSAFIWGIFCWFSGCSVYNFLMETCQIDLKTKFFPWTPRWFCLRFSDEVSDEDPEVSSRPAGARLPETAEVHLPSTKRTVWCLHCRRNQDTDATETKDTDTKRDPKVHQIQRQRKISPLYPSTGRSSTCFTTDLYNQSINQF